MRTRLFSPSGAVPTRKKFGSPANARFTATCMTTNTRLKFFLGKM
jgi:hypothetical protein